MKNRAFLYLVKLFELFLIKQCPGDLVIKKKSLAQAFLVNTLLSICDYRRTALNVEQCLFSMKSIIGIYLLYT